MKIHTDIRWIGKTKRQGDEYSRYTKTFILEEQPAFAEIRYASYGISLLYVNGQFVEGLGGRLPGRIGAFEVTSFLKKGENTVELLLGGHFYQDDSERLRKSRGCTISRAALELTAGDVRVVTDETWHYASDEGEGAPDLFTNVTVEEYEHFWKHAALWKQQEPTAPEAILQTAGEGYRRYLAQKEPTELIPQKIDEGENFTVWDFSRVSVGYFEVEYEAEASGEITLTFDYSEMLNDMYGAEGENVWWRGCIGHCRITEKAEKGHHKLFVTRRRACHYLRVDTTENIRVLNITLHMSIKPYDQKGWFFCDESDLNRIWEVGKYTLQVNRHQEYESCPRHEVKFFIGDGVPDALTDYYAFGDYSLADASLSIVDSLDAAGLVFSPLQTSVCLWDYPAWRVLMVYNHYRYTKDLELVRHYFPGLKNVLNWMMGHTGPEGLIYQYPIQTDPFFMFDTATEYNSSSFRFGEKPYLNALYYRSLRVMSELGTLLGEAEADEWNAMADKVYAAFNERLWSEEKGAYLDTFDPTYIPQDGNAIAVLFGLADEEKTKKIFKTVKETLWTPYGAPVISKHTTDTRCSDNVLSPMMNGYEAEARFLHGDAEGALALIRACWGTMINKGAETFWEFAPVDASTRWPVPAHAWSSGCAYLLSAYVAGIRPAEAGYDKLLFAPSGAVKNFSAVVPTKKGLTAVTCRTENGTQCYTLCLPEGVEVIPELPAGAKMETVRY